MKKFTFIFLFLIMGCATAQPAQESPYRKRVDPISITDQAQYETDYRECYAQALEYHREATRTYIAVMIGSGEREAIRQSDKLRDRGDQVFGNCMMNRGYKLLW